MPPTAAYSRLSRHLDGGNDGSDLPASTSLHPEFNAEQNLLRPVWRLAACCPNLITPPANYVIQRYHTGPQPVAPQPPQAKQRRADWISQQLAVTASCRC